MNARVSSIQRFSVGDGPGIRTTVFFSGCSLRCPWCHNPETIPLRPRLLYTAALCAACGRCAAVCCRHTLENGVHRWSSASCDGCLACTEVCYPHALKPSFTVMTLEEVWSTVEEDAPFYAESGGGVTLSGGEALLQADFCAALAERCRTAGIPVLLDTAGSAPSSALDTLLPLLDSCYYDLKTADPDRTASIGGQLSRITEHLRRIAASGADTVVRTPVIPGFNDTIEDITAIARLALDCGVSRVELLPFHRMGSGKYDALGIPYAYRSVEPPSAAHLNVLLDACRSAGADASLGG